MNYEESTPYYRNPRQITDKAQKKLKANLARFGDLGGIVHNLRSNQIIGGNQRTAIFKGASKVEIYKQNESPDDQGTVALGFVIWQGGRYFYRQVDWDAETEAAANLVANINAGRWDWDVAANDWDADELSPWLDDDLLRTWGNDVSGLSAFRDSEKASSPEPERKSLAERFGVPPFSVLDARQGYWQERKRSWIALGIKGELGRGGGIVPNGSERPPDQDGVWRRTPAGNNSPGGSLRPAASLKNGKTQRGDGAGRPVADNGLLGFSENVRSHYKSKGSDEVFGSGAPGTLRGQYVNGVLMKSDSGNDPQYYFKKQAVEKQLGKKISTAESQELYYEGPDSYQNGTSIFDPVLCELVFRWFAPAGGAILDPFAGESTKGIVATYLGHPYTGVELRQEQVDVNYEQAAEIGIAPEWICGDSEKIDGLLPAGAKYDLIFTSPPYYDLEIYSESEKDGSAFETYEKFMVWYKEIFRQCVERLNDNRFLVVKVGEIRDRNSGNYRNFVGDNISCFLDLGLAYYNEMILVTALGSLPLRVGKQFASNRKIGKTHQNILVFYKGSTKQIKQHFSAEIEFGELESPEQQPASSPSPSPSSSQSADPASQPDNTTVTVKISAKSAFETWNGCQIEYIKNTCGGRCCKDGSGHSHIAVLPKEEAGLRALGAEIENGLLVNRPEGGCPFWENGLCSIHDSGHKPLTCWTSPFTLNDNNTLIVKNRNRKLICYKQSPALPTYKAYRQSLVAMFGADLAQEVDTRLDAAQADFTIEVPAERIAELRWIINKTRESVND